MKNGRLSTKLLSAPRVPYGQSWMELRCADDEIPIPTTPRIVDEYLKLRTLPIAHDDIRSDPHHVQQALRAAERDHDWTAKKAMTMLQYAPSDPSIAYSIVAILRIIERRARRARLTVLSNANYADDNQREFWKAAICRDLDDEQKISEGAPHWDSETEDKNGRDRVRAATQKQLGMISLRLERWLKDGAVQRHDV